MSILTDKQALIDEVRDQYSQGLITLSEYLNGAIKAVEDYDSEEITRRKKHWAGDLELVGLEHAKAYAGICNRLKSANQNLNFYI